MIKNIYFIGFALAVLCGCGEGKSSRDVRIIFRDEENVEAFLKTKDVDEITHLMEGTVYDTAWNNGLMIKMTTPDYTLICESDTTANHIWLMMWHENAHVKYRQQWYILTEKQQHKLRRMLESYRPV